MCTVGLAVCGYQGLSVRTRSASRLQSLPPQGHHSQTYFELCTSPASLLGVKALEEEIVIKIKVWIYLDYFFLHFIYRRNAGYTTH